MSEVKRWRFLKSPNARFSSEYVAAKDYDALSEKVVSLERDAARYREVRTWSLILFANALRQCKKAKDFDAIVDAIAGFE